MLYSQIDQEYSSDHSGVVEASYNLLKIPPTPHLMERPVFHDFLIFHDYSIVTEFRRPEIRSGPL